MTPYFERDGQTIYLDPTIRRGRMFTCLQTQNDKNGIKLASVENMCRALNVAQKRATNNPQNISLNESVLVKQTTYGKAMRQPFVLEERGLCGCTQISGRVKNVEAQIQNDITLTRIH